jgi:hypothetical protein
MERISSDEKKLRASLWDKGVKNVERVAQASGMVRSTFTGSSIF